MLQNSISNSLRFYSTNQKAPPVGLREALLTGQAPDMGLYMPEKLETIPPEEISSFREMPYWQVAFHVLKRFMRGSKPEGELMSICRECYNFPVPLEQALGHWFIMRLDRGPTASFKDFAARMMARWMNWFLEKEGTELLILTATSGDTGSAVAHAFFRMKGIRIVVLFPRDEVSERQRRQMTTLGGNVTTIAVDGKFDDCQAIVKRAFADPGLAKFRLSSANSINIGRLLPQSVYYFYGYSRVARNGEPVFFSVPSGNFGNMMGGLLAWRMGLPVSRILVATNANDEFPLFLQSGRYKKIIPSRVCISNAMNVGHPSNLARVIDLYGGRMDETGSISVQPDLERMRRELHADSIDDGETRRTIAKAYAQLKIMLEPHGAAAWACLNRFGSREPGSFPAVSIETAHPAKFPDEIRSLTGCEPPLPESLQGIEQKAEHMHPLANDYEHFKEFLNKELS